MKRAIAIAGLCLAATSAQAWFFFMIPLPGGNRPHVAPPAALPAGDFVTCVPLGASVGEWVPLSSGQRVIVKAIATTDTQCSATTGNAPLKQATVAASLPMSSPPSAPVAQPVSASAEGSTPDKLRQLQQMQRDGLITQEDYERKKQELLKAF
jgi:hypothetical protein